MITDGVFPFAHLIPPSTAACMSGKGQKTVRVFVRIRPPVKQELERKDVLDCITVSPNDPRLCIIAAPQKGSKTDEPKESAFHHCFDQDSAQEDVYDRVARDTIDDVFLGFSFPTLLLPP